MKFSSIQIILSCIVNTIQETISLPALTPDNFENKTQRIVLFVSPQNQSQHQVIENFYRIYLEIPNEVALFDCDKFPDFCRYNAQIPETPALKAFIGDNYIFTYGEPEWTVEKMAAFIQVTIFQDLFIEMEGTQTEKREQFKQAMIENNIQNYFQFEGTKEQKNEMNNLLMVMKGQAKISYNENNKESLIAYRNGLDIEYKGDLHNNESLVKFVKTNMNELFPKLQQINIQKLLDSNTLCLIIYNKQNQEDKNTVKQFKKFVYYHTKIQDTIGQEYQFAYSDIRNQEIAPIFNLLQIRYKNNPLIMLLTADNKFAIFQLDWDQVEQQLEDYATNKKQKINAAPGAAREFQYDQQDDEF